MTRIRVVYVCDWQSASGDNQTGHIEIQTPTGMIEATWECQGGKGRGPDMVSNSTEEFTADEALELLNSNCLCQGNGTYEADLARDEYGWYKLENFVWLNPQPQE